MLSQRSIRIGTVDPVISCMIQLGNLLEIKSVFLCVFHKIPTPKDLIDTVAERLKMSGLSVILEPGRSLIGNAGLLVCEVLGQKANGDKMYVFLLYKL